MYSFVLEVSYIGTIFFALMSIMKHSRIITVIMHINFYTQEF